MKNRKGMVGLADAPAIAVTLVLIAAVFIAGFLVVEGLESGVDYSQDPLYSASAANGCNSTVTTDCRIATATTDITTGMGNITGYMPVIGVIVGVAILLGIVLAGFGFAKNQGML